MLYVFGLAAAFATFWFVLAALQTFADAAPARLTNFVLAVVFGLVAAGLFWLARRAQTEARAGDSDTARGG